MNLLQIEPQDLYYLGGDERLRHWHIEVDNNGLKIMYGHLNGVMTPTYEPIKYGKGGRSTYQQIKSRFDSRINKQINKGYKYTTDEAILGRTNALGFDKPMLAHPWANVKDFDHEDAYWQFKYNGNRCLITKQNGKLIPYSRYGIPITTIEHITTDIQLHEGTTIDGELYHHGTPLSTIRSWISRRQNNTEKLRLHVYDTILPLRYNYRLQFLRELNLGPRVEIVPTEKFKPNKHSISQLMDLSYNEGYEGIIIRPNSAGYQIGKRSKYLIKIKHVEDDEFKVTKLYRSEKGQPMATCMTEKGKFFDVVLPGDQSEKEATLRNARQYVDKQLTIQFSEWTVHEIPFHAVAICWHDN